MHVLDYIQLFERNVTLNITYEHIISRHNVSTFYI
jgi:hypothetical protein